MQYMHGIATLHCLKIEDMISIGLNVARLPLFYDGHLDTREDVIWAAALLTIASGDVLPLVKNSKKFRLLEDNGIGSIISWLDQPKAVTGDI
jgi:hypothetical protein